MAKDHVDSSDRPPDALHDRSAPSSIPLISNKVALPERFDADFDYEKFAFKHVAVRSLEQVKYLFTSIQTPLALKFSLLTFLHELPKEDTESIVSLKLPEYFNNREDEYTFLKNVLDVIASEDRMLLVRHWLLCLHVGRFLLSSPRRQETWLNALLWAENQGVFAQSRCYAAALQQCQQKLTRDEIGRAIADVRRPSTDEMAVALNDLRRQISELEVTFLDGAPSVLEPLLMDLQRRADSRPTTPTSTTFLPKGLSAPQRVTDLSTPLEPASVFRTPPPPPPQDCQLEDSGPPPPPPGVEFDESAYDEEDLRILREVGDYRFGSILSRLSNEHIFILPHPDTSFDESDLLTSLRASISLTREEKANIIRAIPRFSQFQIDELQIIINAELKKFGELSPKHLKQLKLVEERHADDWQHIQADFAEARRQKIWSQGQDAEEVSKSHDDEHRETGK